MNSETPSNAGKPDSGESSSAGDHSSDDASTDDESGKVSDESGKVSDESATIPHDLPQPAVGRLSLYYRELRRLLESEVGSLSSHELGKMVNVSPPVVRRDLSALGTIGRRGVGYDVRTLSDRIGLVLGSGVQWKVVLVGVGSLGDALLRYRGFERLGFELSAAFDNDPSRIGSAIGGISILDVEQLEQALEEQPAELAILAVPVEHASEIAGRLRACGISGILNFAPMTLRVEGDVAVVNVDLASELQRLAFTVHTKQPSSSQAPKEGP